ncbi:MAG TPA: hypothetical protein VMW08_00970 [Acidimicrobiales bacterium]|nr:hypothetical protein [Acidimicrobiales bacterium]
MSASQAQRDEWIALVTVAALDAVAITRTRMAGALNGASQPYRVDALYDPSWWLVPMTAMVVPTLRTVGAQAAAQAASEYGLEQELEDGEWTGGVSESIAAQTAILTNYGTNEVTARVAAITEQANSEGWDAARTAGVLGLAVEWDASSATAAVYNAPGPVSDGIAENMGETEAHTAWEAGGFAVVAVSLLEVKVWDTSFVNSRFSHEAAHGQTVALGEEFELAAGSCQFPGDWSLPGSERINCQCSVIYRTLEADEVL